MLAVFDWAEFCGVNDYENTLFHLRNSTVLQVVLVLRSAFDLRKAFIGMSKIVGYIV